MTIELTDLDPIPAELVPAAFTLVAVSGPGGPVRYKAPLGAGAQGLTFRGAWTAATAYAVDDVLTNAGSGYVVTAAFTSGQTFSTVGLSLLAAKGDAGDTTDTTSIGGLDAATSAADTDLLHTLQGSTDRKITRAMFLGGTDIATAAVLSSLPSTGSLLFLTAAGSLALLPVGLLPSGAASSSSSGSTSSTGSSGSSGSSGSTGSTGSTGATATAPGQVGSLAAGTPTSTTIPLTWTAPSTGTGTGAFTYAVQVSPHGAGTWSAASGAFGAAGGTVTGLAASTNYDFRVIVTGSGGTSTTSLATGISTAASVASVPSAPGPTIVFTAGPNWTTPGLFGAAALGQYSLGTAGPLVLPNKFCIEFFIKGQVYTANSNEGYLNVGLSDGTNVLGLVNGYQDWGLSSNSTVVATANSNSPYSGNVQFCTLDYDGTTLNLTADGVSIAHAAATFTGGANCILTIRPPNYTSIDNIRVSNRSRFPVGTNPAVPTAAQLSDANTIGLYDFDAQTGASS